MSLITLAFPKRLTVSRLVARRRDGPDSLDFVRESGTRLAGYCTHTCTTMNAPEERVKTEDLG